MIWKALFGGSAAKGEPVNALPVVRNVTLGRQVRLDPLAWRLLEGAAFTLDRDTLEITGQGRIDLGEGGFVHRFYTDDDIMLQAVSMAADGSDADDFTLFHPWSSSYPTGGGDQAAFLARLRAPEWQEDGLPPFARFWYEGDTRDQPPVSLWEEVHYDRDGRPERHIEQTCMLYARPVAPAGTELLLALAMRPEGGDLTHEIMIGVPLAPGEFSA